MYTSKAQMLAFAAAVEAMPVIEGMSGGPGRLLCGITTFKMTTEGWVESQYGMRDLQRAPNGSISQNYIPFLSSVSRTDCHLVYRHIRLVEHMLKDLNSQIPHCPGEQRLTCGTRQGRRRNFVCEEHIQRPRRRRQCRRG